MRFKEFDKQARQRVAERNNMQVDEIMPALGMAAGVAARGAAAAGRVGAKMGAKAGTAAAKAGAKVAQKVGAKAVQGAQGAGRKVAQKVGNKAMNMLAKQMLKKGAKLPLPTDDGKEQPFTIDNVKGDEVVLVNPKPKPGEPIKTVHSKKDLEPILKGQAGV